MVRARVRLGGASGRSPVRLRRSEGLAPDGARRIETGFQKSPGDGPPYRGDSHPPPRDEKVDGDVAAAVEAWRRLGPAQRKESLARIALESQRADPERPGDLELWSGAVHEALEAALGESDGPGYGSLVVRRAMGAQAAWSPVADFCAAGRLDGLRPAERLAVFRLLARLLVQRSRRVADRADIPLTARLVADNARHVSGIFDSAFPGYLASGLVGAVARMLIAGRGGAERRTS